MTDEELQEWLDKNTEMPSGNAEDAEAYRLLFDTLNKHAPHELPAGFAHRVTARLDERKTSDRPLFWVIALGGIGFTLVSVIVLLIFGGLQSFSIDSSGLNIYILFGIALLITAFFTILEKRIAHR